MKGTLVLIFLLKKRRFSHGFLKADAMRILFPRA
jgi:hypothetical protein